MISRMATVRVAKAEKIMERPKKPPPLLEERPRRITMDQRTSDSSAHSPQPAAFTPPHLSHVSRSPPSRLSHNVDRVVWDVRPYVHHVCAVKLTCVGQAEGPEAQVGRCVGDASQTVLNGVDGLVNCYVTKVKL